MNDRKKLEKKKEREKAIRYKLLARRAVSQKQAKEDREHYRAEMMLRSKQRPIRKGNGEEMESFAAPLDADEVKRRLEHNLQILKALEEEYDREQAERVKNETAPMDLKFDGKLECALGGEAECRVLGKTETFGESNISE